MNHLRHVGGMHGFRKILKKFDKKVAAHLMAVESGGHTIHCRTCSTPHCCEFSVVVWPIEAQAIAQEIAGWPVDARQRIANKMNDWLERYRSTDPSIRINDNEWFREGVMCPFNHEGRCEIYDLRPSGCRIHHSLLPPTNCADRDKKDLLIDFTEVERGYTERVVGEHNFYFGPLTMMVCHEVGLGKVSMSEIITHFTLTMATAEQLLNKD